MVLRNKSTGRILIPNLEVANTREACNRGLLGRTHLPADQALWIHDCFWVHTLFMQFPIDLIFVNREMKVKKTFARIPPWRILPPVLNAWSVIELSAGFLEKNPVQRGETLQIA